MAEDPIDAVQEDFRRLMLALGKFRGSLSAAEALGGKIPPGVSDFRHLQDILHQFDLTANKVESQLLDTMKKTALWPFGTAESWARSLKRMTEM